MKRLFKLMLIAVFILNFQACASGTDTNIEVNERNAELIVGYYVFGHEVNAIQPCGSKKSYWVIGTEEDLNSLAHKYETIVNKPYEKIFIKMTGEYLGRVSDGFAAEYDGQVFIKKVLKVEKVRSDSCEHENITMP